MIKNKKTKVQTVPIGPGIPYIRERNGFFSLQKDITKITTFLPTMIRKIPHWQELATALADGYLVRNAPRLIRNDNISIIENLETWITHYKTVDLIRSLVKFWHDLRKKRQMTLTFGLAEMEFIRLVGMATGYLWSIDVQPEWISEQNHIPEWKLKPISANNFSTRKRKVKTIVPSLSHGKAHLTGRYHCRQAAITILGIKKYKLDNLVSKHDVNIIRIVAKMIHDTREDSSWSR